MQHGSLCLVADGMAGPVAMLLMFVPIVLPLLAAAGASAGGRIHPAWATAPFGLFFVMMSSFAAPGLVMAAVLAVELMALMRAACSPCSPTVASAACPNRSTTTCSVS